MHVSDLPSFPYKHPAPQTCFRVASEVQEELIPWGLELDHPLRLVTGACLWAQVVVSSRPGV